MGSSAVTDVPFGTGRRYGISMNTTAPLMVQPDLFGVTPQPAPEPELSGQFADVVFDRPLDHAYTYSVPAALADRIGVGRRVEAPFGKGDTATVGYCVRVHEVAPARAVKALFKVLDDESMLSDTLMRLTRWMADYYLCGWGQVLHAVVPSAARDKSGQKEIVLLEAVPESELPAEPQQLTPKQATALTHLRAAGRPVEQGELIRLAKCGPGPVFGLVTKGYARPHRQIIERFGEPEAPTAETTVTLNPDQVAVWQPLESALKTGGFHAFLLHGVTGSGKTEIYLRAIEETIRQGKEAIVLVPEISLTPQTIERFRGRCGRVAVLHSHLNNTERGSHWRRVAAGQMQVVVGARSAVFAPTRKLGLIIIDEEHESSFKQESTPRYHARDVAVMRARLEGVPILMGSATPSLESWHNAQRGQYTLLTLPNRVLDRPLPRVELIDLRYEPPKGRYSAISQPLERAMREALSGGGQVMLLLNRRGFSTHVHCPGCGHVATCRHCDLSLTYHRQRQALACHYCGFEQPPLERCPACQKSTLRYQGLGTEKLQAEIEEKFPGRVVQRMDSDTTARPG